MSRALPIGFALALIGLSSPAAHAAVDWRPLAFLEGTWVGTQGRTHMEETWSAADGGGMVGMHRDWREGRMVGFEFFRIVPADSAGLVYLTSPGGAPPTPFRAVVLEEGRAVFENPAHDFPQRILYWAAGRDTLHARIEGPREGRLRAMEWTWTRKACR